MIIRYDFGEKLDLTRLEKQLPFHIGSMRELTYHFVLQKYRIETDIVKTDDSNDLLVGISLSEIWRDEDGEIKKTQIIIPLSDSRFQEMEIIKKIFVIDHYKAHFQSSDKKFIVDTLVLLIKLVHKINGLMVFL